MPSAFGSRTAIELPDLKVLVVFMAVFRIYVLYIHFAMRRFKLVEPAPPR